MHHFKYSFLFSVVVLFGFLGCKSSPTAPSINDNSIVGDWNVISGEMHMTMTQAGMTMKEDTTVFFTGTNTAAFDSNHTFLFVSDNGNPVLAKMLFVAKKMALDTLTGTWSLSGNKLTLISPTSTTAPTVSMSGNSMVLLNQVDTTVTSSGATMKMKGTSAITMTRQ
jgi:hypothetical protein